MYSNKGFNISCHIFKVLEGIYDVVLFLYLLCPVLICPVCQACSINDLSEYVWHCPYPPYNTSRALSCLLVTSTATPCNNLLCHSRPRPAAPRHDLSSLATTHHTSGYAMPCQALVSCSSLPCPLLSILASNILKGHPIILL